MRLRHKSSPIVALAVALVATASIWTPALAAPPLHSPGGVKRLSKPRVIPDYGGRDSNIEATLDQSGAATAVDPLAQAGRAIEALVVVLCLVVGGLFLLKKSGVIKAESGHAAAPGNSLLSFLKRGPRPDSVISSHGEPTAELLSVIGSQDLPQSGGARLHLVSVGDRLLLIGATPQSVTLLTEVAQIAEFSDNPRSASLTETREEETAFADYLERIGIPSAPSNVVKSVSANLSATTGRLHSLLRPRVEGESPRT